MVTSTFSGFSMGQLALMASQTAIDITGQNISNINTPGYTRQTLDLVSITPNGLSHAASHNENKVGQGVMMTGVSQIRDPYLDMQYRNQIVKVGTADATDQVLKSIGDIFDESVTEGIRVGLNEVVTQLKNIANSANAGDESLDTLVRTSFEVLINQIHQNASQLEGVEEELVAKMEDTLVPNVNQILKEIAQLNESIKVSQVLGNPALELQDQRNTLLDDLATYLPIDVSYTDTLTTLNVQELKVTFKDENGAEHTLIDGVEFGEFTFSYDAATDQYAMNLEDIAGTTTNISNLMGDGVFKGNMDMLNKSGEFDNPPTDVKGIGFYEQLFDAFVNELATKLNTLNEPNAPLFTTTGGATTGFTATNIKISDGWMDGTTSLLLSKETGAGSTDYSNILSMVNAIISDETSITNNGNLIYTGTIQGIYDSIQNVQSIERSASSVILSSHVSVLNQISDSKESISGVSLDEETMNLMRYQQSYGAASRLVTTLDEMLDKLINGTGVVGR